MDPDAVNRSEKFSAPFLRTLLCSILIVSFFSCNKTNKWIEVDPAFSKYIDAYTTGIISKTAAIRIQLAGAANTTHTLCEEVKETLFNISPSVKGKAIWTDATTIEFKPDAFLQPNQLYQVQFKLGKVTKVPEQYGDFRFSLQTAKSSFKIEDNSLRSNGTKNKMSLNGDLETADVEAGADVEKLVTASQNSKALKINWQHNDATKNHPFIIDGIERGNKAGTVNLNWDGKPMGMDVKGSKETSVPATGDFKVMDVVAVNDAQQYASVQFSDPVAVGQDLTGLITLSIQSDISYTINGSEVKVFTSGKLDDNYTVNINAGIKNTWGDVLSKGFTSNINFENKLPSVKIHGKGNILPNSGRLVLPFESVNLNAGDISIIKIFENNVPQFLQDNNLGGNSDLRRVAKPIVQKTLRLDDDKTLDLHKHQHFSLDIDKFLKTEPGAIYRITIGFRPQYSLYQGTDTASKNKGDEDENDKGGERYSRNDGMDEDGEFWNRYDTYYPYGYNWQRKDDPNSKSYYNKDRWATRNILASNIGLTAKRGSDNRLFVAVSNILTTEPMNGVDLEVMDYQQTIISNGKSGSDGFATIDVKRIPYLLIAKKGNERGYLKLDDGSSLALSRFDVGGEEVKNGIRGFIFGERGVWRPGDTMYIICIIEDKEKKLPKDHPVEFSLFTPQGQLYKHTVQSESFMLPSYIGSVRAMVVAAHEGSYGATEKAVAVKKPLMMLATMPRELGPGETIKLPVTIFAMENNIKNVNVTLQSNPFLEVVGANTQAIAFTQTGEEMLYFDVKVKPNVGIGKVKLMASSGNEKAGYEIVLDIRNPNPPVTSVSEITLSPGQQWNTVANAIGVASTSTAVVEISSLPSMNLQKRLDYLIEYPHGCIEQTTSAVFPQLVLNKLTDLDDYKKSLVDKNVKVGIARMQNFQRPDGGFSYWPGGGESDEWGVIMQDIF